MADIFLVLATTGAGVERYLVLKRVLETRARDPVFAEMFLDEARLSAQLQHPNIAQVYDVGKLEGTYFYTMEYVHGEDIRALLHRAAKQRSALPVSLALYVASGALAALHHAHDRTSPDGTPLNVVHRDVSPSNIMVSYEGAVKLLDFGVAKATQRTTQSQTGSIKGKIAYLSPEQLKSLPIDRRSDLFALGIVLHEMLTGKRLFKREADFQAMMAIATEDVPLPSTLRPDLSPEIDRIVMTALEKDRDKRYPTAAAMLEDIEAVAAAERHIMSATAMSRYMKELFGTKPEPWIELRTSDDPERPRTITSASLSDLRPSGTMFQSRDPAGAVDVDIDGLYAQLDRARDLRHAAPYRQSSVLEAVEPSNPSYSSLDSARRPATPLPVAPPQKGRGAAVIVLATLATLGVAFGGYQYWTNRSAASGGANVAASTSEAAAKASEPGSEAAAAKSGEPGSQAAKSGGQAAKSGEPASAGVGEAGAGGGESAAGGGEVGAPASAAEAAAGDAAKPGSDAAKPAGDAAKPGSDAAPAEAKLTIADAMQKRDWTAALAICSGTSELAAADRTSCGVAACNAKQRATALEYHREASRTERTTIERACRAKGLVLAARPAATAKPKPRPDSCSDPKFLKANPMKCP